MWACGGMVCSNQTCLHNKPMNKLFMGVFGSVLVGQRRLVCLFTELLLCCAEETGLLLLRFLLTTGASYTLLGSHGR
jgi:hypothetical protein